MNPEDSPGEIRTNIEASLEQQSWVAKSTDIRGTWLPVEMGPGSP